MQNDRKEPLNISLSHFLALLLIGIFSPIILYVTKTFQFSNIKKCKRSHSNSIDERVYRTRFPKCELKEHHQTDTRTLYLSTAYLRKLIIHAENNVEAGKIG